jgi:probable FeS assembly SUF system protein SufT
MTTKPTLITKQSCPAVVIPSGETIMLSAKTRATVTQSLGDSTTLALADGRLVRVDGQYVDCLGLPHATKKRSKKTTKTKGDGPLEDQVLNVLRTCYDPEIPVNIVDLGLVYGFQIKPAGKKTFSVKVKMTLTAPGCGMGPVIAQDIERKLKQLQDIEFARVEVVFEPPWDQSRMSEAARLQLGVPSVH